MSPLCIRSRPLSARSRRVYLDIFLELLLLLLLLWSTHCIGEGDHLIRSIKTSSDYLSDFLTLAMS